MREVCEAMQILDGLKNLGLSIAVDDFGTGYSSLNYLKQFPIDVLKIDRTFVDGLPSGEQDAQIARAIIAMAHSLNLAVIAEGVETQEQLDFLREHGCDEVQGYLFGRPMPANKFAAQFSNEPSSCLIDWSPKLQSIKHRAAASCELRAASKANRLLLAA
jgi:EAL domain-containing protein (putative c-di-GMP-specific phosphodiesterase class I)